MATTIKQSQTRKEAIKGPDAFMTAATDTATWVQDHKQPVIIGLCALAAVVLGLWGTMLYLDHFANASSTLYFAALQAENGYTKDATDASTETPKLPEGTLTFATKDEQKQAVEKAWRALIDEYSSSSIGQLGRFRLASVLANAGKTKEALAAYNEFLNHANATESLSFVARERIGYLYEADKDYQKALESFSQLVSAEQSPYQDAGYFHQARMYMQLGDKNRAKEFFERVIKEFPDSDFKKDAEIYLAQIGPLQGALQGPGGQFQLPANPEMPQ
jgi:tetratricopeptide (TPR) repeat protein